MAFSSISGSHTSSTLFPLSTSHLHPIRKAYEFPSFDDTPSPSPSSSSSSSNLKHATSSNFRDRDTRPSSSFYNFENTANAEIREGLERLDLARKREKNVQSAAPDIPLRQNTPPRQPQAFFPVSYSKS